MAIFVRVGAPVVVGCVVLVGCGLTLDTGGDDERDAGSVADGSTPECVGDDDCGSCGECRSGACRPASARTTCREAAGPCDAAETCDGAALDCPPDARKSSDFVCREAVGPCDLAEACDGVDTECPADAFEVAGTPCGDGRVCPGSGVECADCDDDCTPPGACEQGFIDCSGDPPRCVPSGVTLPAGTLCRPAAGPCDVPESCDGMSEGCPVDAIAPAGEPCRLAADLCDQPEACDGSSPTCPHDDPAPSGTACRLAVGACDLEESCDGVSFACPADGVRGPDTCRPQSGGCDVRELCDGVSPMCPPDAFAPDRTPCGAGMACTGLSPTCGRTPITGDTCLPSFGTCGADSECRTGGCSGELCAPSPPTTTCVCPTPTGVRCGCVSGTCGWYY